MSTARVGLSWCRLLAVWLVATSTLQATETLKIRARVEKATLLVGEPVVVSTAFTGASALEWRGLSQENKNLRVMVDRGAGFVPYSPKSWLPEPLREPGKTKMPERRGYREDTIAYDAGLGDYVFPAPGTYRLVVEYQDETVGLVRSNVVSLTVAAPQGDEKIVLDALRRIGPAIIGLHQPSKLPPELETLTLRFPRSVYLQEARRLDLEQRMHVMAEGSDPSDPAGTRPQTKEERRQAAKRLLADLVPIGRGLADVEGQFQPDALRLLARLQAVSGDLDGARETLRRIVRDFPDRAAGNAARDELTDEEPDEEE